MNGPSSSIVARCVELHSLVVQATIQKTRSKKNVERVSGRKLTDGHRSQAHTNVGSYSRRPSYGERPYRPDGFNDSISTKCQYNHASTLQLSSLRLLKHNNRSCTTTITKTLAYKSVSPDIKCIKTYIKLGVSVGRRVDVFVEFRTLHVHFRFVLYLAFRSGRRLRGRGATGVRKAASRDHGLVVHHAHRTRTHGIGTGRRRPMTHLKSKKHATR